MSLQFAPFLEIGIAPVWSDGLLKMQEDPNLETNIGQGYSDTCGFGFTVSLWAAAIISPKLTIEQPFVISFIFALLIFYHQALLYFVLAIHLVYIAVLLGRQ